MSAKLDVVVSDCGTWSGSSAPSCTGATQLYSGTLAAMPASISLGNFAASAKHRYQFSVQLDSTADNHYQGGTSSTDITFNAA